MIRILLVTALVLASASHPCSAQVAAVGHVKIQLPKDARLYVQDVFCPLTGELRTFDTPPLQPGRRYAYMLTVEITHKGETVRVKRQIVVEADRTSSVDFGDRNAILIEAGKGQDQSPKDLKAIKSGLRAAMLANPDSSRALFLEFNRRVYCEDDQLRGELRQIGIPGAVQLGVAEAIKNHYSNLEKIWGPHFRELDSLIARHLLQPNDKDLEKRAEEIIRAALDAIARARDIPARELPKELEYRSKPIHTHDVRIVSNPSGARRYYITAFKRAFMKELGTPEKGWSEALAENTNLGGNYYFKAEWPDGSNKEFGPMKISKNDTIFLQK